TSPPGGSERSERGGMFIPVGKGRPDRLTSPPGGSDRSERGAMFHSAERRFGGKPVEIALVACGDGNCEYLRRVIGLEFPDGGLHVGIQHGSRLDDHRNLLPRFDSALPVIN